MYKSKIVFATVLTSVILFSAACKKDNAGGNGTRLSELVFNDTYDSTGSVVFKYDGNGRLKNISNTFRNKPTYHTDFIYDASGKLQTTEQFSTYTNYSSTQTYYYEGDKLVKKVYGDLQPGGDFYFNYTYNAQAKLIADTVYGFSVPGAVYNNFAYTGNDLTQWETFYGSHTTGWQSAGKTKASYTNANNPFYENGLLFFVTMGDFVKGIVTLSEKLVSSVEYPNGEVISYNYEYYTNGLPKRVTIESNKTGYRQVIDFYYE